MISSEERTILGSILPPIAIMTLGAFWNRLFSLLFLGLPFHPLPFTRASEMPYWLNGARLNCYGNYLYESWIWFLSYDTYLLVPLSTRLFVTWDLSSFGSQFERNVKKYDHWKLETSCNIPRLLLYFSWPQWSQRMPLLHNLTRMVGYLWTSRQPLHPTWTRPLRSFRICWKRMPCCPRTTHKSRMN